MSELGFSYLLGSGDSNAKVRKGLQVMDVEAAIMHLAPAATAGRNTVCPWSTEGCRAACLFTAGRGQVTGELSTANLERYSIQRARINRTRLYWEDRGRFFEILGRELERLSKRAAKRGKLAVARLNGTSDIPFESVAPGFFESFPEIAFYDYTKSERRGRDFAAGRLPVNYHLTYSRSEVTPDATVCDLVAAGANVAVVFRGKELPSHFLGFPVIDGLAHDFRFADPRGVIVGLLEKGRAKRDASGFVVEVDDPRCTL